MTCDCQEGVGRKITNRDRHAAWHALVVEQGGPARRVDAETLRIARGMTGGTPTGQTVVDKRVIERGQRVPGWRRRAAAYDG